MLNTILSDPIIISAIAGGIGIIARAIEKRILRRKGKLKD